MRVLVAELQASYSNLAPAERECLASVIDHGIPLIEFSREYFDANYGHEAGILRPDVIVADQRVREKLGTLRWYLYVIDDKRNVLLYRKPLDITGLIIGRRQIGPLEPVHPMLVPDRLRVISAGELVFLGDHRMPGMIANTKSGHFRPPSLSAAASKEVFRQKLAMDPDHIVVFDLWRSSDRGGLD